MIDRKTLADFLLNIVPREFKGVRLKIKHTKRNKECDDTKK